MIDKDTYLRFCDEALEGMHDIVSELGDEVANRRTGLPGGNTPVQILTHCMGVMGWWAGRVNLGREVVRDRPAEFEAAGPVEDLLARLELARRQFHEDVGAADTGAPPVQVSQDDYTRGLRTQGAVLLHVYEELAQHRGQLEITRDVLRAAG
jgi:uncharacterized damage-inducible protein DinB